LHAYLQDNLRVLELLAPLSECVRSVKINLEHAWELPVLPTLARVFGRETSGRWKHQAGSVWVEAWVCTFGALLLCLLKHWEQCNWPSIF
jgi:hypothetical protein